MRTRILTALAFTLALLAPGTSVAVDVGENPPAFSLPELPGGDRQVSLENFAGKVVYLDFWASWCGPCRVSLPALNRIYADYKDRGLEVVAINVDEEVEDATAFLERFPVDYTLLADPAGDSPRDYAILGMPTAFYIDRNGVVRGVHTGFRKNDEEKVRKALMELLQE